MHFVGKSEIIRKIEMISVSCVFIWHFNAEKYKHVTLEHIVIQFSAVCQAFTPMSKVGLPV